jgi:two-component system sensor histidine kinase HupT/HoxJ
VIAEDPKTLEKLNADLRAELQERVSTARTSSGDDAQVVLSDTGPGIDIQNMNRIFDPFFTTKNRSEGTGLGLFLSYGVVKDHGGRIWAENNGAGGASFFIQLPVLRNKES